MTNTPFTFGNANLTVSYCDVNDYLVVELASGGLTYFAGYADEITDIWSQEAKALEAIGHKLAHQFKLRRLLHGRKLSDIAYHRRSRLGGAGWDHPCIANVTYYAIDVRGDAYALYSEAL